MKYFIRTLLCGALLLFTIPPLYRHFTLQQPHVDELWMDREHHGYKIEMMAEDGLILTSLCDESMVIAPMVTFHEYFAPAEGELLCDPDVSIPESVEPYEPVEGIPL